MPIPIKLNFSTQHCFWLYLHQCIIIQQQANSLTLTKDLHLSPSPSELPGDDGEGPDRAGRLQLQGGQEAVGGLAGAPRLQGLAQAAPCLVGCAVDLNCITQDLLAEMDTPGFHQKPALDGQMG